jgi:hypothetical protein
VIERANQQLTGGFSLARGDLGRRGTRRWNRIEVDQHSRVRAASLCVAVVAAARREAVQQWTWSLRRLDIHLWTLSRTQQRYTGVRIGFGSNGQSARDA